MTDDELLAVLDVDPLPLLAGDDLPIGLLLALTEEQDPDLLRVWLRSGPIELLLARDFGAFEDALDRYLAL